jgi:hypothetical protein
MLITTPAQLRALQTEITSISVELANLQKRVSGILRTMAGMTEAERAEAARLASETADAAGQPTEVPQSAASAIDPGLTGVPKMLLKRDEPGLPEEEGPTPESRPVTLDEEALHKEMIKHYQGNGSLFARFLSSEVITGGKGMLKPGAREMVQFKQDITKVSAAKLASWPTGFYRNGTTGSLQFFIRTALVCAFIDNLMDNEGPVWVMALPQPGSTLSVDKFPIQNVTGQLLQEFAKVLEGNLRLLNGI